MMCLVDVCHSDLETLYPALDHEFPYPVPDLTSKICMDPISDLL